MGFFSKKKDNKPSEPDSSDDFSFFEDLDETDMSSESYPTLDYDEVDNRYENLDYLGSMNDDQKEFQKEEKPSGKNFRTIAIVITVLIIIGLGAVYATSGDDTQTQETTNSEDENDSRIEGSKGGLVVTEQVGKAYKGNDDGNPSNGTGAILAFDYDYYTNRDGEEAYKHFNPDADAYSGSYIQRSIDKVPQGTTYELEVTPKRIGEEYDVVLTITIPGAEPISYNQQFTTMEKDGKFYVKNFTSTQNQGE